MTTETTSDGLPVRRLRQYELIKLIGRGETSAVYQARDTALDRLVAIKLLDPDLAANSSRVWRFFSQSAVAARVLHPNIAQIYFVGQEDSHCFSVREYIDGMSLGGHLAQGRHFSRTELLDVARQILQGLVAAQAKGIVHGNLHAGNVLIDQTNQRVVLSDFQGTESDSDSPRDAGAPGDLASISADLRSVGRLLKQMWLASQGTVDSRSSVGMRTPDPIEPSTAAGVLSVIERLLGTGDLPPFDSAADALTVLNRLLESETPAGLIDTGAVTSQSDVPSTGSKAHVTTIIELPVMEDLPELAEGIFALEQSDRPWRWMQWFSDRLNRWSPEIVRRITDTHAAVDGALAEMERRLRWLDRLYEEGQAILDSLQNQAERSDAKLNDKYADDSVTALDSAISEQQRQLAEIDRRRAELASTIQRLEMQRDLLSARLKVVEARRQSLGRASAVSRVPAIGTLIQITLAIALISLAGYLLYPSINLRATLNPTTPQPQRVAGPTGSAPVPKERDAEFSWLPQELTAVPLRTLAGYLNTEADSTSAFNSLSFCLGRSIVAASSADGTVRIWSLETGQEIQRFVHVVRDRPGAAYGAQFRPDGRTLGFSAGYFKREPLVVDLATGRTRRERQVDTKPVVRFGTTSNRQPFVAGFGGPLVRLDPETGKVIDPSPNEPREIRSALYSPDNQFLAISERNGKVTIWKIETRQLLHELKGPGSDLTGRAFSPDGLRFAATANDDSILVWNLKNGGQPTVLVSPAPNPKRWPVTFVAFSPDSRIVAAIGNGVASLWDHARQKAVRHLVTFSDGGRGLQEWLAFSNDGEILVTTGTLTGQPLLWDVSDLSQTTRKLSSTKSATRDTSSKTGAASRSQKHLAALRRLRYLQVTHQVGINDFDESLRNAMDGFAKPNISLGDAPASWQEVTLNQSGAGFDAIRLTSPLKVPADLYWCFTVPEHVRAWSITRSIGIYHGLGGQELYNLNIPGLRIPDSNRFSFQAYDGGWIRPGEDHCIWFSLDTQDPVVLRFSLTLRPTPETRIPTKASLPELVAGKLGWKLPLQHTNVPVDIERVVHLPEMIDRFNFQPRLPFSKDRFPVVRTRRY